MRGEAREQGWVFSGKRLPEVSLLLCPLALQGLSQGLGKTGDTWLEPKGFSACWSEGPKGKKDSEEAVLFWPIPSQENPLGLTRGLCG